LLLLCGPMRLKACGSLRHRCGKDLLINTGQQVAPPPPQRSHSIVRNHASLEPLEARRPRLLIADRPEWNDAMQSQQEVEV